jgi:hypothetical protein
MPFLHTVQTDTSGPTAHLTSGYWGLFSQSKAAGREAKDSAPSRAEVQNGGIIPSLRNTS